MTPLPTTAIHRVRSWYLFSDGYARRLGSTRLSRWTTEPSWLEIVSVNGNGMPPLVAYEMRAAWDNWKRIVG